MKRILLTLRFIPFLLVISLLSCTKDQETNNTPPCTNCSQSSSEFVSIFISDSSWQRKNAVEFTNNLSSIFCQAGISYRQITELFIVRNQNMQGIKPGGSVNFNEGVLSCTSLSSGSLPAL